MQVVFVKKGFYFTGKIKDLCAVLASFGNKDISISTLTKNHLH